MYERSWVTSLIVIHSASQQVQLFISFVNFRAITEPAPSLIFFHLQWKDSLPYPKHMIRARYNY